MSIYSFILAFFCCVLLLPVLIKVAKRWKLFDPPGPLKLHTRRIPRIGGVAVVSGYTLGILISGSTSKLSYLLFALFVLWLTGIVDDVWGLPPAMRLLCQLVAAVVLCIARDLALPFGESKLFGWLVASFFVLCLINAFNFLDGTDGLAAGVAAIIASGYLLSGPQSDLARASASALLGSCLGFLIFNFPPAKIFLGDSGSTVLGFIIALTGLESHKAATVGKYGMLVVPIFAGLPLLDLLFATVRRIRSGGSPLVGDRRHFYDLLLQKGWSTRKVAMSMYAVSACFVMAALVCDRYGVATAAGLVLLVTIPFLFVAVHLGALRAAA